MTAVTREQISVAFFELIGGAADFAATSRRFVHWDQVNETQMPFLTMLKTGEVARPAVGGAADAHHQCACLYIYVRRHGSGRYAGHRDERPARRARCGGGAGRRGCPQRQSPDARRTGRALLSASARSSSIPATSTARPSPRSRFRFWFRSGDEIRERRPGLIADAVHSTVRSFALFATRHSLFPHFPGDLR